MEDKIIKLLDGTDLKDADQMLTEKMHRRLPVDKAAAERIKASVYERTDLKALQIKRRSMPHTMTAAAVAVIILSITFFVAGPNNVLAAIQKMFHFIPGYGIIEGEGEYATNRIEYIIEQPVTVENDDAILSLKNAVATKSDITVMFEVTLKNVTEERLKKEKVDEWQMLQDEDKPKEPDIYLYTLKNRYNLSNGSWSSGGTKSQYSLTYPVNADEINTFDSYRLEYEPFDISLEFKLKSHETFESLEDIGPTDIHNDISITAVAEEKDSKLNVELYAINNNSSKDPKSYFIYSFQRDNMSDNPNDLHLQTNTGRKDYTLPDSYMSPNTKFTFDITPEDTDLLLKLPFILVQSTEQYDINIDIPKLGEKAEVNKEIAFDRCTLIISQIQHMKWDSGGSECLRLNFRYVNDSPKKVLKSFGIVEISRTGGYLGGGGSWQENDDGIMGYYDFYLEDKNKKNIRLRFQNPVYYLNDEYNLKLNK